MNGKERILATLKGEPSDRAPLWLMDTFAKLETLDEWSEKWMTTDREFISVRERYWQECEIFYEYKKLSPFGLSNRILSIPNERIKVEKEYYQKNKKFIRYQIDAPDGKLYYTMAQEKNVATIWDVEPPLKSIGDAKILMSIPPDEISEIDTNDFFELNNRLGDKGVMIILINTPMVTVSSSFTFEDYLVYSLTEKSLIKEMTEIAYGRISKILDYCLEKKMGPIFRLMGSEQATPPMGSLETYINLVHTYEKALIERIHLYDNFAAVHCHGNVRQILPFLKDAEVDLLDPVEAPPSGDVEFKEATSIVGDSITLAGNIQYNDLEILNAEDIDKQVEDLFSDGVLRHKIVSCTGYPITKMSKKMGKNYHALIDAVFKYGKK